MAMARAVMLYGPKVQDKDDLIEHITSVLLRGIGRKGP
jgi:hypothetical protein